MSRVEARRWLLKFSSGEITAKEKAAFVAWLAASEENRRHFGQLRQLWGELDQVSAEMLAAYDSPPVPLWRRPRALAASFAAAMLCAAFWQYGLQPAAGPQEYSTRIGELRLIRLTDGGTIELGAHSRLQVYYADGERRAVLQRGEAFFTVAAGIDQPFVVQAGEGTVTALGTEFDVRLGAQQVAVAVREGLVAVRTGESSAPISTRELQAGMRISYTELGEMSAIQFVGEMQIAPWRVGKRIFRNAPLVEVVADLNRYSGKPVVLGDRRLESIEVTGIFDDFKDIDAVLRAIDQTLPAKIEDGPGMIYITYQ